MEQIIAVAIHQFGVILSLPSPARHHSIIRNAHEGFNPPITGEQGFLTSTGRFVNRRDAWVIAQNAEQMIAHTGPERELYSEDLW